MRTRWILLAAAAFLLVLVLRIYLKFEGSMPGDRWALHHLDEAELAQPWLTFGAFVQVIGTPALSIATMAIACWFVWRAAGPRAVAFVLVAYSGVAVNAALKVLSGPTTMMVETHHTNALHFPSGHTAYGVVAFGSLAWVAWTCHRRDISAVLIGLLLVVGPMRVVAQTHFVSDVVAGYLVGIGWLILSALVTGYLAPVRKPPEPPVRQTRALSPS